MYLGIQRNQNEGWRHTSFSSRRFLAATYALPMALITFKTQRQRLWRRCCRLCQRYQIGTVGPLILVTTYLKQDERAAIQFLLWDARGTTDQLIPLQGIVYLAPPIPEITLMNRSRYLLLKKKWTISTCTPDDTHMQIHIKAHRISSPVALAQTKRQSSLLHRGA